MICRILEEHNSLFCGCSHALLFCCEHATAKLLRSVLGFFDKLIYLIPRHSGVVFKSLPSKHDFLKMKDKNRP